MDIAFSVSQFLPPHRQQASMATTMTITDANHHSSNLIAHKKEDKENSNPLVFRHHH
jgi:hypothetical protein